jgi:hypothetical protein
MSTRTDEAMEREIEEFFGRFDHDERDAEHAAEES